MTIDPNMARWIVASVAAYFKDVCEDMNLPNVVEGYQDKDETFRQQSDRGEIRISGPHFRTLDAHQHSVLVPTNVMLYSRFDGQKNAYKILTFVAAIVSAMNESIPVYKLGNLMGDDPMVQIGCLRTTEDIAVYQFGEVATQFKQILVDTKLLGRLPDVD